MKFDFGDREKKKKERDYDTMRATKQQREMK